jgi:hypothetical protein
MSWIRALRAIFVAGLLFALVCAMLGSVAVNGHHWDWADSVDAPAMQPNPRSGINFGTTVR